MELSHGHQNVLVIDFGGQFAQLIVRRVRELGVFSELVAWHKAEEALKTIKPDAVILSGGPQSVITEGSPTFDFSLIDGIPVLGICFGLQLMAKYYGATVIQAQSREYGPSLLENLQPNTLISALEDPLVWMSHSDQIEQAPPGFKITARTNTCPVAAFECNEKRQYAVQFHPEVSHTVDGIKLLKAFLFEKASLKPNWNSACIIQEAVKNIQNTVGTRHVLCAVSGGIDSAVVAALLSKAIGHQTTCVFIDHGLLRKNEAEEVVQIFGEHFKTKLIVINAKKQFFAALKGVLDPEEKRKIIGSEFIRAFETHADEIQNCTFLAQGTLYPDVIESGTSTAKTIKTHHNVGGLPEWMKMEVIEPLKWLFKDEVRKIGAELGLPNSMVHREPFPGPGLAIRIIGEVTENKVALVREADWIFRSILKEKGLHKNIWQSYAALLDVRSVGVMGDNRTYEHPIVLRAVTSEDAMTAKAAAIPFETLEEISNEIVNRVDGVNRVVYDLSSKPPATIEWE